jgi:isopenicillin-N epimerase
VKLTEPVSSIERWSLDPAIVHLNHGSFGGCPHAATQTATAWRARLEAAPMKFFVLDWQTELDRARGSVAEFVHAPAERLVFVPSATVGVAIALISVVAVPLPFDAGALIDAVSRALTPRTRLALFDHITSPTALVLPIAELVALCAARGIEVIVDGAHAPGQVALDVAAIGATWYAGNCHKWMCSPKSSGFLVIADRAAGRPVVTSHGASSEYGPPNRLHAELDWSGTHDPSAHLAVPSALATLAVEGGGWPAIYERNHALACEMRRRLTDGAAAPPLAPDAALGCMAAIPIELPPGTAPLALTRRLLTDGWEVQIVDFPRRPMVRVSAHLYNHAGEADQLGAKLRSLGVTIR